MHPDSIKKLLAAVQKKTMSIDQALRELQRLPFQDIGFAKVDTHRSLRTGFPEVIYCQGKKTLEVVAIFRELARSGGNILATRADEKTYRAVKQKFPRAHYNRDADLITLVQKKLQRQGLVAVVSAGTADGQVAEEAAVTAELVGARVERLYDVGIAGIHRLFAYTDQLERARVIVAVAGMEGALPGVVAGLMGRPVIAVPTSVGYGASFQGIAPLLTMLNSCAAGVVVVNINNGFGAGYAAGLINRLASEK